MNIDDFIFSENASTPAGISFSPLLQPNHGHGHGDGGHKPIPTTVAAAATPAAATSNGIPIKSRKEQAQQQQLVPQSVPEPPHHQSSNEFGYVKRHHRKTSIDDRRVSRRFSSFLPSIFLFATKTFLQCMQCMPGMMASFRFLCL